MLGGNMKKSLKWVWILAILLMNAGCTKTAFSLVGDSIMTIEALSVYEEPGYLIDGDHEVTIDNPVDTSEPGTYIITYSAKIDSKIKSLYRTVNVIDTVAPVLSLKGSLSHLACIRSRYSEEGFTAVDAVYGDLSDKVTITPLDTGLKYSVRDASGNLSEMIRLFDQKDTQKPRLTLKGSATQVVDLNGKYLEYGVNVSDNCDDLSHKVRINGNVDVTTLGHYTVTYTVTDSSGNTAILVRQVEVADLPTTTVYLTFDDGPDYTTISVLDTLKKYNMKATFFVLWHYGHYSALIQRAANEGHTIGLHSYTHNYNNIYASSEAFFSDLNKISDYVYGLTGIRSTIYRFPGGSSNTVSNFNPGIMTTLTQKVQENGYVYFDWNVSSGDTAVWTEAGIVNNVTKGIRLGKTNIVLMHDGPNHALTAQALPHILDYLVSINATVLPITMDTPPIHARINN